MNHPRFTAWLCSAAALVLLAVPAFAQQPDALPPEQTAPAAQEQPAEAAAPSTTLVLILQHWIRKHVIFPFVSGLP